MDAFDHHILAIVQRDSTLSHVAIGERVGLSASSVRRRLTHLRETGVIEKEVCLVNADKTGITVIVSIRFEKESHHTYEAFKRAMRTDTHIRQCYTVSGEVDFIVIGHFPDLPAYEEWIGETLLSNKDLQRSDTNIVYSTVKFETAVDVT